MATPSITLDRPGAVLPTRTAGTEERSSSSSPTKINYLNRCVVDMSPGTETYHKISGHLRQTAIAIGMIAYTGLILAAVPCTFILPPVAAFIYLGAALATSIAVSFYAFVFREHFDMHVANFVEPSYEKARTAKEIREVYNALPTGNGEVLAKLRESGIKLEDLEPTFREAPAQLRPILAHYLYWNELCKKHAPSFDVPLEKVDQTKIVDQEKALRAKAQAAFYLGILKSPYSEKKFSDVVKFSTDSENRHKLRLTKFPGELIRDYFSLKGDNPECMKIHSESLSYKDIFTISIEDLSKKIFKSDH